MSNTTMKAPIGTSSMLLPDGTVITPDAHGYASIPNDLLSTALNAGWVVHNTQAPRSYLSSSTGMGEYGSPVIDVSIFDNIGFSASMSTATNKLDADTSCMAAFIGIKNTAHTTNNKMQGLLVSNMLGFNCFDAYAVQGHTTVGAGGVSTQNSNAHITGLSGKVLLSGAVGQGWVTGVLSIIDGAGAVTGLCHAIAAQVEAGVTAGVVDAILFLGADSTVPVGIEFKGSITKPFKFDAVDAHGVGLIDATKQILIDIGGSPYAIPVYAVGT